MKRLKIDLEVLTETKKKDQGSANLYVTMTISIVERK